ncbi:pirin family protein [Rhizobium calliandrae]|uniref:Pirin family protein n=1 Tax=Rhizobium calliandrae TaxID=1312182 RepID=A0ABT7KNP8_9HYPH|nr:pirin family protein [Rhizobium calliandrae]MDL2409772.1 pirin family protein [Rhizobium calliandrae]
MSTITHSSAASVLPTERGRARTIVTKTRGRPSGAITRLMGPSDLGELLKPFVFLDFFEADSSVIDKATVHPHSGIGTITVVTKGEMLFNDPKDGSGTIRYGGLEWMRAGGGVWHGDEVTAGASNSIQGFQLWVALSPELENAPSLSQFIEAQFTPGVGPARVMVGEYAGAKSPAQSPVGMTYLLVTLDPGEHWTFMPPEGHAVSFLSVANGSLMAGEVIDAGELAAFEPGEIPIAIEAGPQGATFVLGSAVPHRHDLVLGYYSVHTSAAALAAGEARIQAIRPR